MSEQEAFEKWYHTYIDTGYKAQAFEVNMFEAWQAATAESENRIAELKANTSQMVQAVSLAADAREACMENEIIALQAHINVLHKFIYWECDVYLNGQNPEFSKKYRELLDSTPAQHINDDVRIFTKDLLQAHDNEVIEQVVTILKDSAWDDGIIDMRVDDLIEDVRKLKGK